MEQQPEHARDILLTADPARVWAALGDSQLLKHCFDGKVEFCATTSPERGVLQMHREDAAESSRSEVAVQLSDDNAKTRLTFTVTDGADQKMADDFFAAFARALSETDATEQSERASSGFQPSQQGVIWAIMFGVLILAVVLTL